ncbi:MAG: vWA domain-containing protein [Candidatus Eisenbacteria bacterium]
MPAALVGPALTPARTQWDVPASAMFDFGLHLAPNAPWAWLVLASLALLALALWAYRFRIPPLPQPARAALPVLRALALLLLVWLLAQPVLERVGGDAARVIVLRDRSGSMNLPVAPGSGSRADAADDAIRELRGAWRGRARVDVLDFASRLAADSGGAGSTGGTAIGDALSSLARSPEFERTGAVVVVSDGVTNRGEDPVAVSRGLGIPIHAVSIGAERPRDRVLAGIEASSSGRVGEATPVRVRITSSEPAGANLSVALLEDGRVLARATVPSPGPGAESMAELRVTPSRAGLALWTARVDSLAGELTVANNARQVAVEIAPGRLGVLVITGGPNWDLAFMRRALAGDSGLAINTVSRERQGWRVIESGRRRESPVAADLRGVALVVLDAVGPRELEPAMDRAIAGFVRAGGGLMVLGGVPPGLTRFGQGALGEMLSVQLDGSLAGIPGSPAPSPEGQELVQWESDPARADAAWRSAAPLADLTPFKPSPGDRVLIGTVRGGPPIMVVRRIGRGPALLVNGTGLWRWTLNPQDDGGVARSRALWRRLARWLAEPVQGEALRIRPERWLATSGEPVKLLATLQDAAFRPVNGAELSGEMTDARGRRRAVTFRAGGAGSYEAVVEDLPPGRYRVAARAMRGGSELGRASTELAVDRWSLEEAHSAPDSTGLAQLAEASGGRSTGAGDIGRWAASLTTRELARGRRETRRLWESPWVFGAIVGALGIEWAWRRRRGLP